MTWRKRKYRNEPVVVDGIKFDSKREAARYNDLKILERLGYIKDLVLQPSFKISKGGCKDPATGRNMAARKYVADFKYFNVSKAEWIVEDVKSPATAKEALFRLKRQLFIEQYGDVYKFKEVY